MKKFLSILLAVMLLAGIMPLVMAEEIENAEAPVEAVEAPAESVEAPAEPAEAPAEIPEAPVSFSGTLSVFGPGTVEPGATVLVKANVYDANMGYSIWWENYVNDEIKWQRIPGATGDCYYLTVNKTSGSYEIRAVLHAEDGKTLTSSTTVYVKKPEPVQPAEELEAPAENPDAPANEPETPAGEPETPDAEPETPAGEPETPAGEP